MADSNSIPRRVRIESHGSLAQARFTNADTGEDMPGIYRAELDFDWGTAMKDGGHPSPVVKLTMLFPTVDVIADAELVGAVTHDMHRLLRLVQDMATYLRALPVSDDTRDELLERANKLEQHMGRKGGR